MPVLGNLVNVDSYVADGVVNSVATLEQAREDMRHLDLPITWIYGQFDNWVKSEFIRDVMSVQVDAPREVISVPIGHNARTSKEGLRLFGTITSLIYRFLHKQLIQPVMPGRKDMEVMRRAEKDRLPPRKLKNRIKYWQRYLIGDDKLLGFDVMALSDDYQQLMGDQLAALELRPGDRLLDLGGGTGNFVEHLLVARRRAALPDHDRRPHPRGDEEGVPEAHLPVPGPPRAGPIRLRRPRPRNEPVSGRPPLPRRRGRELRGDGRQGREPDPRERRSRSRRTIPPGSTGSSAASASPRPSTTGSRPGSISTNTGSSSISTGAARYVRGLSPAKPVLRRLLLPGTLEGTFHLPVKAGCYNKILMSLVLSYIFNPAETLREARRIIMPDGLLVLSSMRPDTDASGPFTRLLEKIEAMPAEALPPERPKALLIESLRVFLNDAQELVDLEEAGTFDFFDPEKLETLLEETGWEISRVIPSYGDPAPGLRLSSPGRGIAHA